VTTTGRPRKRSPSYPRSPHCPGRCRFPLILRATGQRIGVFDLRCAPGTQIVKTRGFTRCIKNPPFPKRPVNFEERGLCVVQTTWRADGERRHATPARVECKPQRRAQGRFAWDPEEHLGLVCCAQSLSGLGRCSLSIKSIIEWKNSMFTEYRALGEAMWAPRAHVVLLMH
jgi:hypothetical protein